MKYLNCIDVSDNQGVIDWAKAKAAGVEFAILRSTRGSGKTDYQFLNNVKGCRENGIPFDVYKYVYAKTVPAAETEMALVCELLKENNIHCIIWYDLEDKSLLPLGGNGITMITRAAEAVATKYGFPFGIYCNKWWYEGVLKASDFTNSFWIAKYGKNEVVTFKDAPIGKTLDFMQHTLYGWQWGSQGRVDGIKGNVDMNLLYLKDDEPIREPEKESDIPKAPEKAYVKAEAATKFDKGLAGVYKVKAKSGLYLRTGAGTNKNAMAIMPYESLVRCYGYYSEVNGVKWYYVVYNGLVGFASGEWLF